MNFRSRPYPFSFGVSGLPTYSGYTVAGHQKPPRDMAEISDTFWQNVNYVHPYYVNNVNLIGYESIESPLGKRRSEFVQRNNPVRHFRNGGFNHAFAIDWEIRNGTDSWYWMPYSRMETYGSPYPNSAYSHQGGTNEASARAWWTIQPRFEGRISMLNFIYELKDLLNLAKRLVSLYRQTLKFWAKGSNIFKRSSNGLVDAVTRGAAEAYLQKTFGIDPLVNDIKEILSQLAINLKELQEKFAQDGEEGVTKRYSEVISCDESYSRQYGDYFSIRGQCVKTKFTAVLDMTYGYNMRDSLDTFLKFWGLTGSASAAWEAMPFSFIVDYFLKVGKAIQMMETDQNIKDLNVLNYCESTKTTYSSGRFLSADDSVFKSTNKTFVNGREASDKTLIGGYQVLLYDRAPTTPNKGVALPKGTIPKDKQILNMGALLRSFV